MTYLVALLFLTVEPTIERESAIKAARDRYAAIIAATEREHLETDVRNCGAEIASIRKAVIDPAVFGPTTVMRDRGDGVFVANGPRQFPTENERQRALTAATAILKKAESNLALWKSGELHPEVSVPELPFEKLAVGQVGWVGSVIVVSVAGAEKMIIRPADKADSELMELSGRSTFGIKPSNETPLTVRGVFWVSGKRTIGKQTVFVVEPLLTD